MRTTQAGTESGRYDSASLRISPGVRLLRLGGHFPGAGVVVWEAGSEGEGSLLAGDTMQPKPDRASVGFMRSYPNNIPLSAGVVRRLAGTGEAA